MERQIIVQASPACVSLPATAQTKALPAPVGEAHCHLGCPQCGLIFEDDGFSLECPIAHDPALLVSRYASRKFEVDVRAEGLQRYGCWLPNRSRFTQAAGTIPYKSARLNSLLQLPNLWIAFSGYWPEKGAELTTATFKELEVCGVLSRLPHRDFRALVVASAGNTAAAFARACSVNDVPCLIVIPARGMQKMHFAGKLRSCVKVVSLTGGASYSDAIALAGRISAGSGFISEGGVKNVGRRDGMATAMLSAVEAMGKLPDYYFQAVGSGAGAIAAHEAAKRLVEDSRFGCMLPRLMLSQNLPFTPLCDAWKRGTREFIETEPDVCRSMTNKILASVLSNQRPPYSIVGGVFDVLSESGGEMFAVTNDEALLAMQLFKECEGIDIEPAAGVALASLAKAAESRQINPEASVLLHITGGGALRRASSAKLRPVSPDLELSLAELDTDATLNKCWRLFAY
jgi:cysteate synthase